MTIQTITFRIFVYVGVFYLVINLLAFFFSEKLIFEPQASTYVHLQNEIKIPVEHGEEITAVYLPVSGAKWTILSSHGNAEDLGTVLPFMKQFQQHGFSVLLYDYRGYGTSDGSPSEKNAYKDIAAAYHWLVNEKKVDPKTIIVHGRSVGGGPSTWLAAHYKVGGLILESTFLSAFRVKTKVAITPWDKFDNLKNIKKTSCPVLVIHGKQDSVIPFWHGEKLYEVAPHEKMNFWVDLAAHNDLDYRAGKNYFLAIQKFVELLNKKGMENAPKK